MIRGTTPTIEFDIPFDVSLVAEAYVTFKQRDDVIIEKAFKDCNCRGNTIYFTLTQEETLKLECSCMVEIQARIRTTDGTAIASDVHTENVNRILKDGVI